jgi:hypothetical protein
MDSEPEFGSVVPMESCRPQWLRPVLSSDCQELDRSMRPTSPFYWPVCCPVVPMWFFTTQLMPCVQPRAYNTVFTS